MTPRRRGVAIAGLALLAAACADTPDPLDRATVAELSRSRGDAQGGTHSGDWLMRFELMSCTCPVDVGLCIDPELAELLEAYAQVVEGDGFLTVQANGVEPIFVGGAEFSGPIDADGTVTVGFVTAGLGFDGELFVVGRLDGEFDGEAFSGSVRQRASGRLRELEIDCRADLEVEATRAL